MVFPQQSARSTHYIHPGVLLLCLPASHSPALLLSAGPHTLHDCCCCCWTAAGPAPVVVVLLLPVAQCAPRCHRQVPAAAVPPADRKKHGTRSTLSVRTVKNSAVCAFTAKLHRHTQTTNTPSKPPHHTKDNTTTTTTTSTSSSTHLHVLCWCAWEDGQQVTRLVQWG